MTTQTRVASHGLTTPILLSVGALAMLGPLSTDIFLPALPAIAEEFQTTADRTQLALSATTIGMAAGQLFSGPLSDAIGRRRPLLVGSAGMAVFAIACSLSSQLWMLIAACFLVGCCASTGATVGRAVVSDVAQGKELTRGFALLGTLMSLGPIAAPVVGVLLMIPWGWRGVFVGLAIGSALASLAIAVCVPETLDVSRRVRGGLGAVPRSMATAVRSRAFWCGAVTVWAGFAATFAYIASSSYVLQIGMGYSAGVYAIIFAANGVGLMITGLIAARLSRWWTDYQLVGLGIGVLGVGAILIAIAGLTGMHTPWLILPGFFLLSASCGLYIGPGLAVAVRELRDVAGTALALLGSTQFVIAGIIAPLSVIGGGADITPLVVITLAGTFIAAVAWVALRPKESRVSR